ncbi:FusB/FusC family EF-G-binding protein [Alteribacillus sp. JSM 102045]|uniref:FusB/FusC family EF-G-binding protein n=1 Tax=Alteribacillus sp. JSM 102045 TaxID=1562101 RepID=UPI0035BFDDB2
MTEPFIQNHHLNVIKNKGRHIQYCFHDIEDASVLQAVKGQAADQVKQAFSKLTKEEEEVIDPLSDVKTSIEVEAFIGSVYPYVKPFPAIDKTQIKKLFPNHKKMQFPVLENIDFSHLTYLGWNDPGQQKKYLIYELDGELVGVTGRYTQPTQRNYCYFCNELTPVHLVSIKTDESSSENPDYYRSIGQYICKDSEECNKNITDVRALESFIRKVK